MFDNIFVEVEVCEFVVEYFILVSGEWDSIVISEVVVEILLEVGVELVV